MNPISSLSNPPSAIKFVLPDDKPVENELLVTEAKLVEDKKVKVEDDENDSVLLSPDWLDSTAANATDKAATATARTSTIIISTVVILAIAFFLVFAKSG